MEKLKSLVNIKLLENCFFIFAILFVTLLAIQKGDNIFAILSAVFGLTYTFLLGKGKAIGYIFGIIATLSGAYLSFYLGLYGFFALHLFYYFPMEIIGFFNWEKNTDSVTKEVIKTALSNKERILFLSISTFVTIITIIILKKIGDSSPVLDGIITVFSLLGMYFSVRRCFEEWFVWAFVNFLSVIMWFSVYLQGSGVFSIFLKRIIYLILGIYFFCKWYREVKRKS